MTKFHPILQCFWMGADVSQSFKDDDSDVVLLLLSAAAAEEDVDVTAGEAVGMTIETPLGFSITSGPPP